MTAIETAALVNRNAAGFASGWVGGLGARFGAFCASSSEAEAEDFLANAVERGARAVVVGGGDGTIAHAMTALWSIVSGDEDELPAIAIVRLGTGNAIAEAFDLEPPTPQTVAALAERVHRRELGVPLRTLRVGERLGCFCGFGVDAQLLDDHQTTVAWLGRRGLGRLARGAAGYAISCAAVSLPRFALAKRPTVTAINRGEPARAITSNEAGAADRLPGSELWRGDCTLAACATIETFGFGLRMFTSAAADRDRFQLRISDASLFEIITRARDAFRGEYTSDRVHDFLCDAVELRLSRPAPFELNGDSCGPMTAALIERGPTFELL